MLLSRTMTAPTNFRAHVERVDTSRAMFMKYSSQETRTRGVGATGSRDSTRTPLRRAEREHKPAPIESTACSLAPITVASLSLVRIFPTGIQRDGREKWDDSRIGLAEARRAARPAGRLPLQGQEGDRSLRREGQEP